MACERGTKGLVLWHLDERIAYRASLLDAAEAFLSLKLIIGLENIKYIGCP